MGSDRDSSVKYALGIECSNPSARGTNRGEVALAEIIDDGLKYVGSIGLPTEARGSDGLMGAIDALCAEHGVSAAEIGRVVVSVGPGGYTALRISVTVAKVLGMSIGCGVVAVPTAAVAGVGLAGEDAVVALASKKGRAHCTRVVGGEMTVLGVIGREEIANCGAAVLVGDSYLPSEMVEAAQGAGMEVRGIELKARGCLEASVGIGEIDPGELSVLYAREPDAVTQWRALGKGK